MSKLGPLPEFGRREGRGLTTGPQLDEDALGSLLGSHRRRSPASKSHRPKKATGTRESEEANFYDQLAILTSEENEEEDIPVSVEETKQLVDSVDVDDMDASLFGSFSHGQRTKGRPSKSTSSAKLPPPSAAQGKRREWSRLIPDAPLDRTGVSPRGEKSPGLPPAHTGERRKESSDVDRGDQHMTAKMNGGLKAKLTEEKPKSQKSELDEDLLDLLSDSDHGDVVPKTRTKPKIQLRTGRGSKPSEGSSVDGKPITSGGSMDEDGGGGEGEGMSQGLDRPKPKSEAEKQEELDGGSTSKEKRRADTLKSLEQQRPAVSTTSVNSHRQSSAVDSFSSSKIDFGEDGDDLLSGMGLDESTTSTTAKDFGARRGSKIDELFGTVATKTIERQPAKNKNSRTENAKSPKSTAESGEGEEEKEDYQFGAYLPSAALDGGSLKPRRRYSSDDALTSRPSTAPVKKSVRFADVVETSDRPSSSPAVTEPPKPSLKGTRRSASVGRPKEGGEATRKPPLPRGMNAPAGVQTSESEGLTEHQEGVMHSDSSLLGVDKQNDGEFLSTESLFPSRESTPKHQTSVKGRGKSGSLQTSSAAKLFDKSQKQDETDELGGDQTSVDVEGPCAEEEFPPRPVRADERLEHPLFPWQMKGRSQTSTSSAALGVLVKSSATPDEGTLTGAHTSLTMGQSGSQERSLGASMDSSVGQSSHEQLLQQQWQVQEQLMRLQSQGGEVYSSEGMPGKTFEGGVGGGERQWREWKAMQERVKEAEALFEQEKAEKQRRICEVQQTLRVCEEGRGKMEEECRVLREKAADLERENQTLRLELTSEIDDLKLKLHRAELERDQFRQSLEVERAHHTEELGTVQSANEARLQAMEESFQRQEARWRKEMESEASRFQERLQQAERERLDAVTALRRKVDSVEVVKANEISRLQEIHRAAVVDLKNEHELDKQHLQSLHRQEVEALKTAHSHTRLLSELTRQVEVSSREVSQLQLRIDHAHSRGTEEREQGARAQEEHLKMLEDRLSRQQAENEVERGRLQSLIAKLEAHVAQQSRQIEQERWHLQQEGGKLKAQQAAFEEERTASLRRVEEEKDHLQLAREKFLSEQREVLTQCYEERRSLAAERAELSMLQRRALEREKKETQRGLQAEAELESSLSHLREENVRVAAEGTRVREEGERWRRERETLERDREKLETFGRELQQRSQEIEDMCQSAVEVHDRGERSLLEAKTLQQKLSEQSRAIETQLTELREREKRFAAEQLALAQQKRELQHLVTGTRSLQESQLSGCTTNVQCDNETLESGPTRTAHETLLAPLRSSSLPPPHSHITTTNYGPPPHSAEGYTPRASPVHIPLHLSLSSSSVKSSLAHLQHSRNMREMVLLAEKDREDLEEESKFLDSLQNNVPGWITYYGNTSSLAAT